MQILVTIDEANKLSTGIWSASLSPANVRQLGTPAAEVGSRSVILLDDPRYNSDTGQVAFPFNAARVLNLGSTDSTIFVAAGEDQPFSAEPQPQGADETSAAVDGPRLGLGDRQLLRMTANFPSDMQKAAASIVEYVRELDPSGDFQRERNRYVNRRDNFVAIEPQTRNKQLLINVRGKVATQLSTLSTFNGYTAFKLAKSDDLPQVLRAIEAATRKPY